jgi:hypothetical protein
MSANAEGLPSGAIELQGHSEIHIFDNFDEPHLETIETFLINEDGRFKLIFEQSHPHNLTSGTEMSVIAIEDGQEYYVLSYELFDNPIASIQEFNLGEQKTVLLLVNFQNNTQTSLPTEEYTDLLFRDDNTPHTLNHYFRTVSNNQTWFTGNSSGYFTLPFNDEYFCGNFYNLAREAIKKADLSVNFSGIKRIIIASPYVDCIQYAGASTLGTFYQNIQTGEGDIRPSVIHINGFDHMNSLFLLTHEIGHSFGLHHSNYIICENATIGRHINDYAFENCETIKYWDNFDPMGSGFEVTSLNESPRHFSAYNKKQAGFLSLEQTLIVYPQTQWQIHHIVPQEIPVNGIKNLEVHINEVVYTIEYRRSFIGDYDYINPNYPYWLLPSAYEGAFIRIFPKSLINNADSLLIDATPYTSVEIDGEEHFNQSLDSRYVVLKEGSLFSDTENNFYMHTISVGDQLTIYLGLGTCGNGIKEEHEVCELNDNRSCRTIDEQSGRQTCNSTCSGYNECIAPTISGAGGTKGTILPSRVIVPNHESTIR